MMFFDSTCPREPAGEWQARDDVLKIVDVLKVHQHSRLDSEVNKQRVWCNNLNVALLSLRKFYLVWLSAACTGAQSQVQQNTEAVCS